MISTGKIEEKWKMSSLVSYNMLFKGFRFRDTIYGRREWKFIQIATVPIYHHRLTTRKLWLKFDDWKSRCKVCDPVLFIHTRRWETKARWKTVSERDGEMERKMRIKRCIIKLLYCSTPFITTTREERQCNNLLFFPQLYLSVSLCGLLLECVFLTFNGS